MSERKVVLWIWAAVISLLIGSMALAGFLASRRPDVFLAHPTQAVCVSERVEDASIACRTPAN